MLFLWFKILLMKDIKSFEKLFHKVAAGIACSKFRIEKNSELK